MESILCVLFFLGMIIFSHWGAGKHFHDHFKGEATVNTYVQLSLLPLTDLICIFFIGLILYEAGLGRY